MANRYTNQRNRVTPPHVSLRALRKACGLTLDQVCERVSEITGKPVTRGALSAIEGGLRGASDGMLRALAQAYDLDLDEIDVQYTPRGAS